MQDAARDGDREADKIFLGLASQRRSGTDDAAHQLRDLAGLFLKFCVKRLMGRRLALSSAGGEGLLDVMLGVRFDSFQLVFQLSDFRFEMRDRRVV
jgi:hypothetical protein